MSLIVSQMLTARIFTATKLWATSASMSLETSSVSSLVFFEVWKQLVCLQEENNRMWKYIWLCLSRYIFPYNFPMVYSIIPIGKCTAASPCACTQEFCTLPWWVAKTDQVANCRTDQVILCMSHELKFACFLRLNFCRIASLPSWTVVVTSVLARINSLSMIMRREELVDQGRSTWRGIKMLLCFNNLWSEYFYILLLT